MPKVSVIIPTYNRANYICETIDSVLSQTFKDFEIIIVDDGSTDHTRDVLEKYRDRINYHYQVNEGAGAARNKAISLSRGEYLGFIDDDDLWLPNKLEVQVKELDENPDVAFVCSGAYQIDGSGQTITYWSAKCTETFENLYEGDFVLNLTVLLRRKCFDEIGGGDASLIISYDYDLWLRVAKTHKFKHINAPLAKYRLHGNNLSKNHIIAIKDHITIISKKYFSDKVTSLKRIIRISREYYDAGVFYTKEQAYFQATRYFLLSILRFPCVGYYYWPKEIKKMRLTLIYRLTKPYLILIKFFCIALFQRKK